MAEIMANVPHQRDRGEVIGCLMANFFRHNSATFDGSQGLIKVDIWISDLQELLEMLDCTDKQKVKYVGLKLSGEALRWWKAKKQLLAMKLGQDVLITWDRFKREFNDRFFPYAQQKL